MLAAILDSAVDGIIVIDAHGRIETFNRAAEQLFGYREADVVGRNVSILMPPPYRDEHDGYMTRYLSTGNARIIGIGREVAARRSDGTVFPVHLAVGEMSIDGERKFTGIVHNLSDRVHMEDQLREQAALVRLGEMAAVVAHEVKNPLAGIRGAMQIMGSRMTPGSGDSGVVDEIIARIDTLNDLIGDLLLFARPPQPKLAPVDIRALVAATVHQLHRDPALGDIHVEIVGSAPPIVADSELLKIVFLNLLINGAHAMGGRGRMRVTIQASSQSCEIAFIDDGPGIPSEIRHRIFTPFFTTKSRGTGLGLPTAKRLVEAHQGTIDVECPAAGGTRMTVRFPLAQEAAEGMPTGPALTSR